MMVVLEIAGLILQIFLIIFKQWMSGSLEEKKKLEERLKNVATLLKRAAEDKSESINELDYISNLDWEKKLRFDSYKKEVLSILKSGGGLPELKLNTYMGLGERLLNKEEVISDILNSLRSIEDKSIILSKELIEI